MSKSRDQLLSVVSFTQAAIVKSVSELTDAAGIVAVAPDRPWREGAASKMAVPLASVVAMGFQCLRTRTKSGARQAHAPFSAKL